MKHRVLWLSIVFLVAVLFGSCNSIELQSDWTDHPLVIDGQRSAAWDSVLMRIEDKPFMVGLLNDRNDLYLTLVTDDRGLQRQIAFRGLTVWFDYQGGDDKRFGIHFPLGPQPFFRSGFLEVQPPPEGGGREWNRGDSTMSRIPLDTNEADIIGPAKDETHRVNVAQLKSVAMKIGFSNGSMVYQLKVPLADNGPDPYAIGTKPGSMIGIGLETGARPEGRGGGGREGGMGGDGFGGGRRGGFGGEGFSQRSGGQQTEPLDVWAKVQLATNESVSGRH